MNYNAFAMQDNSPSFEGLQGMALDAWLTREVNRQRAKQLAESVRSSARGDERLHHCADTVIAYTVMREGWLTRALNLVLPALAWFEDAGESRWLARALNVHNCVTAELGEYERCIVGLGRQLEVSRQAGDVEMEACALHDFGAMHIDRDPARAELHLHEALEVFARQGNAAGQGYALLNLTQLCIGRGDTRQAQDFLERTTRLCEQHTLNDIESFTLMQRGCLQLEAGRLEVADELFCKARERSQAHGGRPLSEVMPFMVDLYRRQGRLPEMRTILETHLEAMMERNQLPFAMQAHELLTDVLEELGDIGGALRHSRSHLRLFRQVYHAEQEDKVRALEVLHRTQLAQRNAEEERRKNVQLKTALDQLEEQTRSALEAGWTDELTGLRNRRYLTNLDVRAWSGQAFAVAMVDLDYFKAVNDRYGHPVGDAVLREFAALLKHRVRDHDIVARFGGEEFVILFPATALEVAASALERLSAELRAHVWNALDSSQRLTFTAGIAVCADGDLEDAMTRADRLLYAGKASGRNTLRLERALF